MAEARAVDDGPQWVTTSAAGTWTGGMQTEVRMRHFPTVVMDEPPALGGADAGPNPMEYVMAALDGCTSVMISLIAKEMNFDLKGFDISADGRLDLRGLMGTAPVSPHFHEVRQVVRLRTSEPPERVAALREEVLRRCPAYNLIKDARVPITSEWSVEG